jgi:hypothetical protein
MSKIKSSKASQLSYSSLRHDNESYETSYDPFQVIDHEPEADQIELLSLPYSSPSSLIPDRPKCLHEPSLVSIAGDLFLTMTPLIFLFLFIAAVYLNNKAVQDSKFGSLVESLSRLSPNIFPIIFAAIVGRSMKMIARFSAEKGAKLETLELMTASQSTWATIKTQSKLNDVNTARKFSNTDLGYTLLVARHRFVF